MGHHEQQSAGPPKQSCSMDVDDVLDATNIFLICLSRVARASCVLLVVLVCAAAVLFVAHYRIAARHCLCRQGGKLHSRVVETGLRM